MIKASKQVRGGGLPEAEHYPGADFEEPLYTTI